ncbi:energy-coupling factor transport system ATP-binding protein [Kribbella amoyensis]|uniref:Energy-coupling factor transport system ATP-binding protein n=1 Tax=Kribbella amoyensis TaxID=996641 RepID=A0A561BWQ6_9ACTN|nr:ABC transporter ATP-binding protein [Kribbella amoyensis]TWD83258.1 energy-coupling factor transport system ATP-binding protein [Kribbella amoyensis]
MIEFNRVTMTYDGADRPAFRDVSFTVPEGELALVIGRTGSGKSTLLRAIHGLVPHFTGGTLAGRVLVAGRDTREHRPRDLADVVGIVGQDPMAGFVTDTVEEELAYSMESIGIAADVMRRRVEETLDLLGLAEVRDRPLTSLSGGQRQRTAIGAALTSHPAVLVLDEPTSALDPQAAEEVLAALQRLVHDLGVTVIMAEHRLERVIQYADRVIEVPGGSEPVSTGLPADLMVTAPVAPPVVELGRLAGWSPLPLSVRDARRAAGALRDQLDGTTPPQRVAAAGTELAKCNDLVVGYGNVLALRGVSLSLRSGEIVALMGRNGAGKSTLLNALVGLVQPRSGKVTASGLDPRRTKPAQLVKAVGLVPQEPADLLYAATVAGECAAADADFQVTPGRCRSLLDRLAPDIDDQLHPRDLSEGQRLCLALAVVLCGAPPLLLLDEPTRGLDYGAKRRLVAILRELAAEGHAIVLSTHDVELVAEVATRVLVLAEGDLVSDGETATVIAGSPAFAPQVAKILAPLPFLTVGEVETALERAS